MRGARRVTSAVAILIGLLSPLLPHAQPTGGRAPAVSIRIMQPNVRVIDGITVDIESGQLRASSNLRLAVVPAASPDAIADMAAFALDSTPISAGRVRLTLPGGPAGQDEVRLYHIPRFGKEFAVAARAPVTVDDGVAGAVLVRELGRAAARLGQVKFEARYRGKPVLVQAQFLRVLPDTEWSIRWANGLPVGQSANQVALISLGTRGVAADSSGSSNEALCIVAVNSRAALDRVASLNPGDAILVEGEPTTWSAATAADPVLLRDCHLRS